MIEYFIAPIEQVPENIILEYWTDIHNEGLLQARFCEDVDPTPGRAIEINQMCSPHVYFIITHFGIRSEFTLTNFTGKSAMVHFSMHPSNSPQQSMYIARTVTDQVLDTWKFSKQNEAFLLSMYGLTPVNNRSACAFVRRVGFRKLGILKGGQLYAGIPVDAMITTKESAHGRR